MLRNTRRRRETWSDTKELLVMPETTMSQLNQSLDLLFVSRGKPTSKLNTLKENHREIKISILAVSMVYHLNQGKFSSCCVLDKSTMELSSSWTRPPSTCWELLSHTSHGDTQIWNLSRSWSTREDMPRSVEEGQLLLITPSLTKLWVCS